MGEKEPTIEDHIKRAKELTIPQVSVREEAFTELVKAVEKMYVIMRYTRDHPPLIPPTIGVVKEVPKQDKEMEILTMLATDEEE